MAKCTIEERFWSRVQRGGTDECWPWTAGKSGGYGVIMFCGRNRGAHRVAWGLLVGPVPEGLTLDHLCRNRACVNPAHLEAVTNRENILRGVSSPAQHARQTECVHGHPFDEKNTGTNAGRRQCRQCQKARDHHTACVRGHPFGQQNTDGSRRQCQQCLAARNARRTHCLRGHPFDEKNTYTGRGWRQCRECMNALGRRRYAARRAS